MNELIAPPKLIVELKYRNQYAGSTTTTTLDVYGMGRGELLKHLVDFIRVCGFYVGDDEVLDFYRE